MKHKNLLLLFISLPFWSYSQHGLSTSKTINGTDVFLIGDSIEKFNSLLSCAENSNKDIINLTGKLSCKAFRYLPAETDSVTMGRVKFGNVFLAVDSFKKIWNVEFNKEYLLLDSSNPKELAETEYEKIIKFLNSLLQAKGKVYKLENAKTSFYSQKAMVWQTGTMKYVLLKTEFKNYSSILQASIDLAYSLVK